jgi:hypothetical protein
MASLLLLCDKFPVMVDLNQIIDHLLPKGHKQIGINWIRFGIGCISQRWRRSIATFT